MNLQERVARAPVRLPLEDGLIFRIRGNDRCAEDACLGYLVTEEKKWRTNRSE